MLDWSARREPARSDSRPQCRPSPLPPIASPEEKEYVRDVAASIEDRIRRNTGDVDYLDRVMARRVAIELHIVSKATDYVENVSGLTETIFTEHGSHEKKAALLGEIRKRDKSIFKMLKELGVLDDPESQKADALERWRGFVEGDPSE